MQVVEIPPFFFFLKKASELMEKGLIKAITEKSSYFETSILKGATSANHSHMDILMSMSLMSLQWVKKKRTHHSTRMKPRFCWLQPWHGGVVLCDTESCSSYYLY